MNKVYIIYKVVPAGIYDTDIHFVAKLYTSQKSAENYLEDVNTQSKEIGRTDLRYYMEEQELLS